MFFVVQVVSALTLQATVRLVISKTATRYNRYCVNKWISFAGFFFQFLEKMLFNRNFENLRSTRQFQICGDLIPNLLVVNRITIFYCSACFLADALDWKQKFLSLFEHHQMVYIYVAHKNDTPHHNILKHWNIVPMKSSRNRKPVYLFKFFYSNITSAM